MSRRVFFISDGTAITAETIGQSLLTQFPGQNFRHIRLPFVDTREKARDAVVMINRAADEDGAEPLVFNTSVDLEIGRILAEGRCHVMDLFGTFLGPMEKILGVESSPQVGKAHGMRDQESYEDRMEATNYALTHDDGITRRLDDAEVILLGVSRSGKTPTCLYLALHYGVKAANYPLTEEDLEKPRLPEFLRKHRKKLYGLSIDYNRLASIREIRRPNSKYASVKQCRMEVEAAEALLRSEGIPVQSSTSTSVEEIASRIMVDLELQRELF